MLLSQGFLFHIVSHIIPYPATKSQETADSCHFQKETTASKAVLHFLVKYDRMRVENRSEGRPLCWAWMKRNNAKGVGRHEKHP